MNTGNQNQDDSVHNKVATEVLQNIFLEKWLTLSNTATGEKEAFKSIKPGEVSIYSCWPTVYSEAHIWNLRAYIFPDVLKRIFEKMGYKVDHIINITDVWHLTDDADSGEDKMEKKAHEHNENVWDISRRCTDAFKRDLGRLNIIFPRNFTKATEYIWAQIEMIQELENRWFTYRIDDGVYFDTSKFPQYADFARLDVENLNEGERVEFGNKRNKTDFALWKFSPTTWPKRQMEWESPWWTWFPGWHIECSAMIWKELWEKIDIHTWGTDHIPVHHTNEIAQATCSLGENPANYWLHGEFLVLQWNEKVWKSKWNSLHLSSLIEEWFDPLAYRYLVLMAHYKSFLTYTKEALKGAQNGLIKLKKEIKDIFDKVNLNSDVTLSQNCTDHANAIINWILDDLNTAVAIAKFRAMLKDPSLTYEEKIFLVWFFDDIFGLGLLHHDEEVEQPIPNKVSQLAQERWECKKNKNFSRADELRKELEKLGYGMKDGKDNFELYKLS